MQVRKISLNGFMHHVGRVDLELPARGVVLITGHNGAGKSRFVEGVSYAGWGKTLRGTDPRRAGEPGGCYVSVAPDLELTRFWNDRHKVELSVEVTGQAATEFDTATKAQAHLTNVLGEWDTWRRSCAFSSVDDLSFATATDAERKRLLEGLLGLQRFDTAWDRCRADQRTLAQDIDKLASSLVRLRARKAAAEGSLSTLEAITDAAAPHQDLAGLRIRLKALEGMLPARRAALRDIQEIHAQRDTLQRDHAARTRQLQSDIRSLLGRVTCPTCNQAWPSANDCVAKAAELEGVLQAHIAAAPAGNDSNEQRHAVQQLQDCTSGIATLQAELTQAEAAQQRHTEAKALVADAKLALLELADEVEAEVARYATALQQDRHLETTADVLGTKGARAHMLHDALTGLESVANAWLDRVARVDAPLQLKLSPYTERKSGGTSDSISLEIIGAGGGKGYRAASGGEQRRIDVALMLALAQVAQEADGRSASTMFFDEVFDALDAAGREAVVGVLDELAQDRCVVVMSHSSDLVEQLVPDVRVVVEAGAVDVR